MTRPKNKVPFPKWGDLGDAPSPRVPRATPRAALREKRVAAGLTIIDVSDKLGITKSHVAKWERGEVAPRIGQAKALIELIPGLTLDDLVLDGD